MVVVVLVAVAVLVVVKMNTEPCLLVIGLGSIDDVKEIEKYLKRS